jgi:hypothetical protein
VLGAFSTVLAKAVSAIDSSQRFGLLTHTLRRSLRSDFVDVRCRSSDESCSAGAFPWGLDRSPATDSLTARHGYTDREESRVCFRLRFRLCMTGAVGTIRDESPSITIGDSYCVMKLSEKLVQAKDPNERKEQQNNR